jgi:ribosomal protein L1
LKKFNLDVADISRVDWIVSFTKFGKNENITVRAGSRNFKVETLMNNSEKMIAYLKANVDESIIRTEIKNFSN